MRGSVRAFLAVLLLALFPFVVVALGVGGVITGITVGHRVGGYLAMLSIGLMIALGFALVQALRTRLTPPDGPRLTREQQPGLWQLVDELAKQAHTRPPDEIILVPEINAAVSEDSRLLGLREGKRYMEIGLPLLGGLTVSELRSVLAHEIGHYGGGHTRLLAISYRGAETLGRTVARLDGGPAKWVLGAYARLYALVSRSANRAQELQADAYSVAAVGRATASSALRKIATMDIVWKVFGDRFLSLPGMAGRTPDLLLGFRSFLDDPHQQQTLARIEPQVLDSEPSSLFDSHPTIRRRIAAIEALPDNPAVPDQRPAWSVLANPTQVIPAAEAQLFITGDLGPRASWAEIVRLAGAANAARGAYTLPKAAHDSGAAPHGTLDEILHAVQRGDLDRIMQSLLPPALRQDQARAHQAAREGLVELLGDVIVSALISQERARYELNWGGAWRIVGPAGELNTDELVGPVVQNPALVPQLRERLHAMGVPLDFVRWPSATPTPQRQTSDRPDLLAVAPEVSAFGKNWDVFVHDSGLLLVPLKTGTLMGQNLAGAIGQAGQAQRKRIAQLLEAGPDKLFDLPDAKWLALAKVSGPEHKKFLTGGGKVQLQLAGVGPIELRTKVDGSYEVLAEFFDAVQPTAVPPSANAAR